MFLASFARSVASGCQSASFPEQTADEPTDRPQSQARGHQSGTAHGLHGPRLPNEGAARWMRHTRSHRIHDAIASIPPESKEQAVFRYTPDTARSCGRPTGTTPSPRDSGLRVLGVVVQETPLENASLTGGERAEDPLKVVHRGELDRDLSLLLPQVDLHAGLEAVREAGGKVAQCRGEPGAGPRSLGARNGLGARSHEGDDLLDGPHRQSLGHD